MYTVIIIIVLLIFRFLVEFGCDVNAQDSDGWTPLHCAASCNNLAMVKFLVENGACLFAATLSDHETPAEKCEEDEEGFDGCSEYLYSKYLLFSLLRIIGCLRVLNQERLLRYLRVESSKSGSFAYEHS